MRKYICICLTHNHPKFRLDSDWLEFLHFKQTPLWQENNLWKLPLTKEKYGDPKTLLYWKWLLLRVLTDERGLLNIWAHRRNLESDGSDRLTVESVNEHHSRSLVISPPLPFVRDFNHALSTNSKLRLNTSLSIQCNPIQFNLIQSNSIQFNFVRRQKNLYITK